MKTWNGRVLRDHFSSQCETISICKNSKIILQMILKGLYELFVFNLYCYTILIICINLAIFKKTLSKNMIFFPSFFTIIPTFKVFLISLLKLSNKLKKLEHYWFSFCTFLYLFIFYHLILSLLNKIKPWLEWLPDFVCFLI